MTILFTASYQAYRDGMGQALVTSRGLPRWRAAEAATWPRCWLLAPTRELFGLTGDEFNAAYTERLSTLGAARIGRALETLARQLDADRLVLLCFEPDVDRCHRGMFARWWLTQTGEDIAELK